MGNVQGHGLDVGTISSTGAITYLINGFGLPSCGLGGTWLSVTTTKSGLTDLGAAAGLYNDTGMAGTARATTYLGSGYA